LRNDDNPPVVGVRDGQITSFRVVEDTAKVAAAFR
jgi:hypothetical protein